MKRESIKKVVKEAASANGYKLYSGMEYALNSTVKELPALWMEPAELTKVEGREEGWSGYNLNLTFIERSVSQNSEDKNRLWEKMERSARDIMRALEESPDVVEARVVRSEIGEHSLTNRGELSMKFTCSLVVPFFREC